MAIAFVKDFRMEQGFVGTTMAVPVPAAGIAAGNTILILAAINNDTATLNSVVDDKGNGYSVDESQAGTGDNQSAFIASGYIDTALVNGDTIDLTFSIDDRVAAILGEFSGLADTAVDQHTSARTDFGTTHTSGATGTTTQADELVLGGIAVVGAETWTANGSYTTNEDWALTEWTGRLVMQHKIVSATGTYEANGTTGTDTSVDALIATYKAAAGGTPQVLAPSADSVDGNWTNQAGNNTDLFDSINETTASDTDYVRSELSPANSATRIKLSSGGDPQSSTGHEINWRIAKDAAGGQTIGMTVKLYQGGGNSVGGGTLIASFTRSNVTNTFTDFAEALSGAEADSITNYADLYLEFWANAT